jgi:hypothetical protein
MSKGKPPTLSMGNNLEVRSHDMGNAANLCIVPDFIDACFSLPPSIFQSFQRYNKTNLVPVLKAISDGSCYTVDSELSLVAFINFNATKKNNVGQLQSALVLLQQ